MQALELDSERSACMGWLELQSIRANMVQLEVAGTFIEYLLECPQILY